MNFRELQFVPYEKEFNGRENALVAEKWIDDENGIRVINDYSMCSVGENNRMYWIQLLKKNKDGSIETKDCGYQLENFIDAI